ncbi:MAG: hypothetical protein KF726_09060 [Anaerolineae bacterium]|nr:hypothetical protein [Anaerolineae bacterium]
MIPDIRRRYNAAFSVERYQRFLHSVNSSLRYPADFKVSETPLFIPAAFASQLLAACDQIIAALQTPTYRQRSASALSAGYAVPHEDEHTLFLQIDFAICREGDRYVPRLIELQGFPSLFGFQAFLDLQFRQHFDIPAGFNFYFSGLDYGSYVNVLRRAIVADHDPEKVILLEVMPDAQGTRIDFAATEQMLGIRTVALDQLKRKGSRLFYEVDGRRIPIERIYNRVIRDDPKLKDSAEIAWLADDLKVSWAGHPNWYYRISKYSLPILHELVAAEIVPPCYFVDQLRGSYPADLNQYVLKPLFLFSGAGVQLEVTGELLDSLADPQNYILQRKVQYAACVETPDDAAFAEVRMLYVWQRGEAHPLPVSNLVRLSKGKMMGVRYNRDKTWVGSTLAYIEQ